MAGLDLTPRAHRAIGLTKQNRYTSLHGGYIQQAEKSRKPTPPINDPPRGSSSDEESDGQQIPEDGVSDDSEFGGSRKKRNFNMPVLLSTGMDSNSAKEEDGEKGELSVEPSNIRAGNFTSGTGVRSRNSSQSSQKRKCTVVDDDDIPFSFSQQKKPRQSYGSSTTTPRGSVKKLVSAEKKPLRESEKAARSYRPPGTDTMLARADRLRAKLEIPTRPGWKETPSMQASQRDQRASQRSVKSTQESSQSSSKIFKQPLRPSPKKVPKFRAGPVMCETLDPLRATAYPVPAEKSHVLAEDNELRSTNLQNAVTTATDKLGMPTVQFKLPPLATPDLSALSASLDVTSTASSPLSSLDGSTLCSSQEGVPIITSEDIQVYSAAVQPAVCPMCKQPVDPSYLEAVTKVGMRMSLRQQAQFCKAHKERSAESEWAERGYPEIDWPQLDTRLTRYHTFVDDILSRRKFSFYRNVFEDSLRSGKNKTLHESLIGGEIEGTSPGYYGGRGAKVMADNIMSRFASKLRRLAASDKLISSGGVSRYVQAVLVPELGVLLIKDDMKVDEEKAREVLRDSVDIGNLLNEEEDEMITDPAPKEQEVIDMM